MGTEGDCDAAEQVGFEQLLAQVAHGDLLRHHSQGRLRPGSLRFARRPLVKDAVRRATLSVLRAVALAHVFQRTERARADRVPDHRAPDTWVKCPPVEARATFQRWAKGHSSEAANPGQLGIFPDKPDGDAVTDPASMDFPDPWWRESYRAATSPWTRSADWCRPGAWWWLTRSRYAHVKLVAFAPSCLSLTSWSTKHGKTKRCLILDSKPSALDLS